MIPVPEDAPSSTPDRFPIEVPGFRGTLEQLVSRAQRGDIDLHGIELARITGEFRGRIEAGGEQAPPPRDVADFLALAGRLMAIKAAGLDPTEAAASEEDEAGPPDDRGRRLSEYRLFKAAAETLLAEAADEGARSFLSLVAPEVLPVERLRIPPERLAAAFREVLARLTEAEPLPVGAVTFSVAEKVEDLQRRLQAGPLAFEALFSGVSSRLEAVACFLALLELLRQGEADVDQEQPFGPITVRGRG